MIIERMICMANKTAAGLVKHMKKCLQDGWGYVYGTIGQTCTERLLDQCAERYPANNLAGGAMRQAGEKWLGKKVADCSGIVKAYLMSEYTGGPIKYSAEIDSSVHYSKAKEKGPIGTMPDIPGILVYMPSHVGVYVGNGEVIESAGTLYGVKQSTVEKSYISGPWTHWYKCPGIAYDGSEEPETEQKPAEEKPAAPAEITVGSAVKIKAGATYTNGVKVPDSVTGKTYTVQQVNGEKALLKEIVSWVGTKYLTAASGNTEPSEEKPATEDVDVTYRVRAGGKWYPAVKNLSDFAGKVGVAITDVAMKVSKGSIKYRVHVKGDGWLSWVTGYDINDKKNGYAGVGEEIDAIQVYYYTPDSIRPYKRAKYRVSPVKDDYYGWQYDTETTGAQDGYAGAFGQAIDRLQIVIE